MTVAPLQDVVGEARRILDAAADIPLRALGGAAIALSTDRDLLLPREYKDIDFVTAAGRGPEVVRTFDELGYAGDQRFNGLNGHRRLLFYDTGNERQVDVFVNKFEMCHVIPLAKRLTLRANTIPLGSQAAANQRVIRQYIHENGIKSCQLVMGYTALDEGSVWNSMPPHTHSRRTEIYFYFDLKPEQIVAHFLGAPDATRHVFIHNEQAVLAPAWSIHCGCGTAAYKFIWAMAGENQTFDDMDKVNPLELK